MNKVRAYIKECCNMSSVSSGLTCRDNTPYVDPEEEILVEDYAGKHQYVIVKKRPALSRTSEEDADDFDMALVPGTWEFKFAIKPSDKSLEVWFGRTEQLLDDVEQPDPLEYKCIAIFFECTSIRDYGDTGDYEVMYGSGGTESMFLPITVNDDQAQFPWHDLTCQFSPKALRLAIAWANTTLSMLTVHGCFRQSSTLNRYCIQR